MKKTLAFLLALFVVFSNIPLNAFAETVSGRTGDCEWVLDESGHLTITGKGKMADFTGDGCGPWGNAVTSVVVTDGVTNIGAYAFSACDQLISVSLGKDILSIDDCAFRNCNNLTEIVIPDATTTIGKWVFYSCDNLSSVHFGRSVKTIDSWAFAWTPAKYTLSPDSLYLSMYDGVIYDKEYTTLVLASSTISGTHAVKDGVAKIASYAFYRCQDLEAIVFPNTVTSIDANAFVLCDKLTSLVFPDKMEFIGSGAFSSCANLTSVIFQGGEVSIETGAFNKCSALTEIILPEETLKIGEDAFLNTAYYNDESNWENGVLYCGNHLIKVLNTVSGEFSIKEGTGVVAAKALYGCRQITKVTIPDGVTTLGKYALANMELTAIKLPSSIKIIDDYAFSGQTRLNDIVLESATAYIGTNILSDTGYYKDKTNWENGLLYIDNYLLRADKNNVAQKCVIREGTTVIAESVFSECPITSVVIPEGVEVISYSTFGNCTNLSEVVLPKSVTTIEASAFFNCKKLSKITYNGILEDLKKLKVDPTDNLYFIEALNTITGGVRLLEHQGVQYRVADGEATVIGLVASVPETVNILAHIEKTPVTAIGGRAFADCEELVSLTIPSTVKVIEDEAFSNCASLKAITMQEGLVYIGPSAFDACVSLTSIALPNSLIEIDYCAFSGCAKLENVVFSNQLQSIGEMAFFDCASLTEISLPDSITEMGSGVFSLCSTLQYVKMPYYLTVIPADCFGGCQSLKEVIYPRYLTRIENGAFMECLSLGNDFQIPNTVTYIGDSAFALTEIATISIPAKATTLGEGVFGHCERLSHVRIPDGVTTIPNSAFSESGITSITIPLSVTRIGSSAFYNSFYEEEYEFIDSSMVVYYLGTEADRAKIKIGEYNKWLEDATWYYECAAPQDQIDKDVDFSVTEEEKTGRGLAFRFQLLADGVTVNKDYTVNLSKATVNYKGSPRKLLRMGVLLTNNKNVGTNAHGFNHGAINGKNVIDVPIEHLMEYDEETCTYAVRIINIPKKDQGKKVYALPYYVVEVNGKEHVIYDVVSLASCSWVEGPEG